MMINEQINPTDDVDISFSKYVAARNIRYDSHMEGGIPDYAYALDYSLRQKIRAIPGAYPFFKAMSSTYVPLQKQLHNMKSVKVSSNQFPKLHAMLCDCANTLGIGIPTMFVVDGIGVMNAMALTCEDAEPLIIMFSAMVERLTDAEMKAIIGHECGHIHNNHGIYNMAVEFIKGTASALIPGVGQILALLSVPVFHALQVWSRAGEVTADRAGIICCGEHESTERGDAKLTAGGIMGAEINIDEFVRQYDMLRSTPVRMMEWLDTHPAAVRRILADREFMKSEVYYKWHPEQKQPNMKLYTKKELDEQCDRFISVTKSEKRRDR
ncbi:MAG: heat shock protein HtpX [Firmicutes bacterium ADurb.Bin248]|nr:MAG: heat shock protein HtpX [Firmicutes bacterium ADurb.Bin248]